MRSRMDRYLDNSEKLEKSYSRTNKNSDLYENIGKNRRYTNFTDVSQANAIDISKAREKSHTREGYHQIKEFDPMMQTHKVKRELDEFNYLYQDHENKVYDINTILEEARKNRVNNDALEECKKLKNTNYNILADLNPEALKEYKERKSMSKRPAPDEDEIKELIDTITSKTLAGQISQATSVSLLSDLMATSLMDKVKPSSDMTDYIPKEAKEIDKEQEDEIDKKLSLSKEILDKEAIDKVNELKSQNTLNTGIMSKADSDFYTRSMDLSDKDFDLSDEFEEKSFPIVLKIIIILIILAVLAGIGYFIYKNYL